MWEELRQHMNKLIENTEDSDIQELYYNLLTKMQLLEIKYDYVKENTSKINPSLYMRGRVDLSTRLIDFQEKAKLYYNLKPAQNMWGKVKNYLPPVLKSKMANTWNEYLNSPNNDTYNKLCADITECIDYAENSDLKTKRY